MPHRVRLLARAMAGNGQAAAAVTSGLFPSLSLALPACSILAERERAPAETVTPFQKGCRLGRCALSSLSLSLSSLLSLAAPAPREGLPFPHPREPPRTRTRARAFPLSARRLNGPSVPLASSLARSSSSSSSLTLPHNPPLPFLASPSSSFSLFSLSISPSSCASGRSSCVVPLDSLPALDVIAGLNVAVSRFIDALVSLRKRSHAYDPLTTSHLHAVASTTAAITIYRLLFDAYDGYEPNNHTVHSFLVCVPREVLVPATLR
ncbi:hypothetical protein PVAR5_2475 [Paecilomyces variotii No. 5]|uniref:Uncharacterized protein n=1 Tax=Byssochlamys spectabilis (strain No. 5 / NBRC 109023) TaxID=1356009 RepID=V5FPJ4_BYSSN|nr:hypothetical protein PVAR5_2475 [Paecilomyces variotii No. 5]